MILTRKNTIGLYYTSATASKTDDTYLLIATNVSTKETMDMNITATRRTLRYDFYEIDTRELDLELGYWDYVIVDASYDISYNTIYDIQKKTPRWILERGKWLVTAEDGRVPTIAISSEVKRKTYKGK